MKKIIVIVSLLTFNAIGYADKCSVIGFHQPGTQIYNGPTFCKKIKTNNITVYGPLTVADSIISKQIEVSGPVNAMQSTLSDITLKPQFTSQTITLKNTLVTGDIHFEGKPGVIILSGNSKIQGKIINGKIMTQ